MLLAQMVSHGAIPWTIVLIPFVLLPLLCATLGIAWFLSALGVYIRDIIQITGIVTTIFLFISPGVLSSLRGASRISNLAQAQPSDFRNRGRPQCLDLRTDLRLDRLDLVCSRQFRGRLGRILVVSENPKRVRRCRLERKFCS